MRDLFFLAIAFILIFMALRRPFVGLALWLWSGLFVPVFWLYGIASGISYNTLFAALTGISYLFASNKPQPTFNLQVALSILLFLITTISSATTIVIPELVWIEWDKFFKVMILFFATTLILRKKSHFDLYIWAILLSIGFYAVIEGLKFIASGGGHKIHGPYGHILADNNHLAISTAMILPFFVYQIGNKWPPWLRIGLIAALCISILAVLGTHSRGGFIALLVVGGYFWLKSNRKLLSIVGFSLMLGIAVNYLPDNWYSRMSTIETATQDGSFMSRVVSWKIHTLMAMDRPLLGGGFKSASYGYVWRALSADLDRFSFFSNPPPGERGWAAHSIYFQVLGDHGFVALFLYLAILAGSYFRLGTIEKTVKKRHGIEHWHYRLARMTKLSLVTFAAGGASVSLPYYELYWAIIGMSAALTTAVKLDEVAEGNKGTNSAESDKPLRRRRTSNGIYTRQDLSDT